MNPAVSRAAFASSTYVDPSASGSGNGNRRSSESARTMPMPGFCRDRSLQLQERTRSMSATASIHVGSSLQDQTSISPASTSRIRAAPSQHGQPSSPPPYPHRSPIVYPALLSRVAEALRARIVPSDIVKDGLTYRNAFDGRQAVDKIAYIIKTTDRNLALLLGRALDAQKYFHGVTCDHRLRDSPSDVYHFRTRVGSPFHSGELSPPPGTSPGSQGASTPNPDARTGSPSNDASAESDPGKHLDLTAVPSAPRTDAAEDVLLLTEVFTLLTDCYSPKCSRDPIVLLLHVPVVA